MVITKLTKKGYKERLVDQIIEYNLQTFGAISLEGLKWCGKTWTALNNSNSVIDLSNMVDGSEDMPLFKIDLNSALDDEAPETIDEWQGVPHVLDVVCDKCGNDVGRYLLTSSVKGKTQYSGMYGICKLNMYTMSLYESGDSSGEISLCDLFENVDVESRSVDKKEFIDIASLIVRGGWPEVIDMPISSAMKTIKGYVDSILDRSIGIDGVKRDREKMKVLLKALARNESTVVANSSLISDIEKMDSSGSVSRNTVADYLNILDKLYLIEDQNSFIYKIRLNDCASKNPKRHFSDPSLGCAILNYTPEKLVSDEKLFSLYFEALVERDLRIYSEYTGAKVYHYRNSKSGMKVDAIIGRYSGDYGAIEIELDGRRVEMAVKNLKKFYDSARVKPKFMCVICGECEEITRRIDGIYVLPITALRP